MTLRTFVTGALGAAALVAATSLASAADIPMRARTVPAAAPAIAYLNWTGLYVGVHGGYGSGSSDFLGGSIDTDGWFAGGQIGYNWQMGGSPWVFGVEADLAYSNIEGSVSGRAGILTASASSEIQYFGTARGRIGYAINNVLPYVTGGFAWANNEITLRAAIPGVAVRATDDQTQYGYAVGAGLEWAFAPMWSAKVEYLYLDLGSETYFGNVAGGFNTDIDAHTVKVGLNYRFN